MNQHDENPATVAGSTRQVVVVTRVRPSGVGGLAGYHRCLLNLLNQTSNVTAETFWLTPERSSDDAANFELSGRDQQLSPFPDFAEKRVWPSLASRPVFHPLLQRWIEAVGSRPISGDARPDVIHYIGTGWDFLGFAAHRLARKYHARFTVWPAVHPETWGDDKIDTRLYRLADVVFCQSEYEMRHLEARGVKRDHLTRCAIPPLVPMGGDGTRLRQSLGIGSRVAILFVGRRDAGKGFNALLAAWKIVTRDFPDAVVIFGGGGCSDSAFNALPHNSWRDLGSMSETEKADAFAACDVFCLPSAHESFGIVFAEAWAYGKPVICGPAPATCEWIGIGNRGMVVEQNPLAIAEALSTLISNPQLRFEFGNQGRTFQRAELSPKAFLRKHLAAFGFV